MPCGRAIQRLIPGSRLVELPLEDQDVPLVPFPEWAPHEETIARASAPTSSRTRNDKKW